MFTVLCKKACAETGCHRPLLTAGMANAETIEFNFSADWDTLTKTAVFTDGKVTVDVLQSRWLTGNTVNIPSEVLATAGRSVRVGVYGTNASGVVLPTVWATLGKVQPGADPSGDETADPSLPVWEQLQEIIGDLSDLTTKAKENLVAAINEAAKTGSGGAGSIDLRTADGYIQYSNDGGATWENLIALADLKGETGQAGPDGAPGKDGIPGKDGADGAPGQDGFSPSASVAETATGATITITDKTGTTTAEIKNGKDGAPGKAGTNGKDGAPGATGPQGPAGKTPVKGTDYFTEADKQEIASAAAGLVDLSGKQNKITASGILKGDGAGGVSTATPGTDYLTEAPVKSVNGATGEVKSTFYVTVTQGDDGSVTADKTAEEVYAAYAAGYTVYAIANFSNIIIPLTLPLESALRFSEMVMLGFAVTGATDDTANPSYWNVAYNGSAWLAWAGTLAKESDIPTKLKNPYSLNIKIGDTTTSYDGSAAKTVEIPKGVPFVTTADNGKFLRVVNGAWEAAAIDNANGGSF